MFEKDTSPAKLLLQNPAELPRFQEVIAFVF
jgi:hypothetical protein